MLKKLHLENFKSWEKLDLELSNLNFLFGTNSSGNTSILSSLLLLKQTATGFNRLQPINPGGNESDYVYFGSYKDFAFRHDELRKVGISLDWTLNSPGIVKGLSNNPDFGFKFDELSYTVRWRKNTDHIAIDHLEYQVIHPEETRVSVRAVWENGNAQEDNYGIFVEPPIPIILGQTALISGKLQSCYLIEGLTPSFVFSRSFEELMQQTSYLGPLRDYPKREYLWKGNPPREISTRGEGAVELLLSSERNASRQGNGNNEPLNLLSEVSNWLVNLGLAENFQVKPLDGDKRFYEILVDDNPLIDVGFGVSQVLPVIVLLFSVPEGSLVLIEQPEIHLHPSAQAELADLFLYAAEKRNLQLIIESHSEHLLRRLQRRIAEREHELANPEHIKMHFCDTGQNGSTIQAVKVDRFGQISNWPENFFGDIDNDLEQMTRAGLKFRRQELWANE